MKSFYRSIKGRVWILQYAWSFAEQLNFLTLNSILTAKWHCLTNRQRSTICPVTAIQTFDCPVIKTEGDGFVARSLFAAPDIGSRYGYDRSYNINALRVIFPRFFWFWTVTVKCCQFRSGWHTPVVVSASGITTAVAFCGRPGDVGTVVLCCPV